MSVGLDMSRVLCVYDHSEYGVCMCEMNRFSMMSSSWKDTDGHLEEGQLYIVQAKLCASLTASSKGWVGSGTQTDGSRRPCSEAGRASGWRGMTGRIGRLRACRRLVEIAPAIPCVGAAGHSQDSAESAWANLRQEAEICITEYV